VAVGDLERPACKCQDVPHAKRSTGGAPVGPRGWVIRPAVPDDLAAVEALSRAWSAEDVTWGLAPTPASFLSARVGQILVVAVQGSHVRGYALGRLGPHQGEAVFRSAGPIFEIEEVYVDPGWRRQGVGGSLLESLVACARDQGATGFLVSSAAKDFDAVTRFYARQGFQVWSVQMFLDS